MTLNGQSYAEAAASVVSTPECLLKRITVVTLRIQKYSFTYGLTEIRRVLSTKPPLSCYSTYPIPLFHFPVAEYSDRLKRINRRELFVTLRNCSYSTRLSHSDCNAFFSFKLLLTKRLSPNTVKLYNHRIVR